MDKAERVARCLGIVLFLFLVGLSSAFAQQRTAVAFKIPAADLKYTQNYAIDVGDVPGHQIRIYEAHADLSKNSFKFRDTAVLEMWLRDYSDYVDANGRVTGYVIYALENGEKVFSERELVRQNSVHADGARKSIAVGVERITGGTGGIRAIRGSLRVTVIWDTKGALTELQYDGDYWLQE